MSKLLTALFPLLFWASMAQASDHDSASLRSRPFAPAAIKSTCSFLLSSSLAPTRSFRAGRTPDGGSGGTAAEAKKERNVVLAKARAAVFFGGNPHKEEGRGGEGILFSGIDPRTGEAVVVKFPLVNSKSKDDYFSARDIPAHVAKIQTSDHSGKTYVLPWVRVGSDMMSAENGDYLVMPLVRGEPMGDALKKMSRPEKEKALLQMAEALEAVQKAGFSHNDVKESNFIWNGQSPILVDWNLSRPLGENIPGYVGSVDYRPFPAALTPDAMNTVIAPTNDAFGLAVITGNLVEKRGETYAPIAKLPNLLRQKYVSTQAGERDSFYAAIGSARSVFLDVSEVKEAIASIPSTAEGEAAWYRKFIFEPLLQRADPQVTAGVIGSNPVAAELFFSERTSLPATIKKQVAQSMIELNRNAKEAQAHPQAVNYSPFIHARSLEAAVHSLPVNQIASIPEPFPPRPGVY